MKRFIRPDSEDYTPRTQSDALPTSGQSDVLSDPPDRGDVRDAFMSDCVGAAPAEPAQQNVDANAIVMQQMQQMQLTFHHSPRNRQLKSGSVNTDISTVLHHHQVAQLRAMADACAANGRMLKSVVFDAYAKLDVTLDAHLFNQLHDYAKGLSVSGQVFLEVPMRVGYYDGRPDETVTIGGRLMPMPSCSDGNLWIHLKNVHLEDIDLVNAVVRRVLGRMEKSLEGQRIRYQVPKFQAKVTYKMPARLTIDDEGDLKLACDACAALKDLKRVAPKCKDRNQGKAPQLLILHGEGQGGPWKAQVYKGAAITVTEW
jgi:hypothetical protein